MPRKLRKNIRKRKRALKHPIVKLTPQQQLQQQMMNDPTMLQQMSSNPMLLNRVIGAQSGGLRAALLAKMAGYGGAADGTAYNPQSQMNLSSLKNQITDVKKSNIDIQKQISENEKKLEYDRHTKKLNELNVEKKKKEEQLKELSTEEYAKKVSEKAAEVAKMEQDVINLKNHTTQYKVLKDEEIKQKALKTYMDSDEYKKEVEANVKAEKLLQLQNQTVQYENLAQESKNNDAAMQKAMKSAEYIKANNDWLDAQANAKAAQLIGSIRTKIQADEDSSNEALMNADFKNAFEALHSKVKLVNDFSSGKKLKSEGFDNELREVAQNMTKITDAATRQAVQSAYDAVRATVVESQEKELQQTKTDLVNAFLKTKSQVGHYAADGTYVPAGGTYIPPDEVQETPQEEVQIQPDMEEIVQQQQLEEPEGNEQVPPLETTEINDARLKRWVKAFPFTKDIIGNMERKPEWLQKHIFGNELIPYGQALFEELEPETQERVMQTIREDSNTNYDKIFLGYRLPEMGDQSPKAKRTWEIYNILGEHEAKMQQLEAEGKLPKATPKKKSRTK
ncbi:protein of unknown function, DUF4106 family [Trichomonas vaginalis G3]|uniref:protein of unknown function, DUF4106 family n=1 Tax=Trichomonas vaginalis (strain ATCC PRA-98 / G3) TaxID=412133 RepID=UPI0021E58C8A|nr:protein of unknown function, DUF4106 family [Trichomonas vaginalis G3]KAI5532065.1 protein of unknown function, DUF4106 family [Trichomonas vaginalis G3]